MNERVSAYLSEMEGKIQNAQFRKSVGCNEEKSDFRKEVLEKAGFYKTKKEYAPAQITKQSIAEQQGYDKVEILEDGMRLFYREVLSDTNLDNISDEEILAMKNVQEKLEAFQSDLNSDGGEKVYILTHSSGAGCLSASILKILAVIVWVGGFFAALALNGQSFGRFFEIAAGAGLSGLLEWALAAICDDIHATRCCLESLKLEKK